MDMTSGCVESFPLSLKLCCLLYLYEGISSLKAAGGEIFDKMGVFALSLRSFHVPPLPNRVPDQQRTTVGNPTKG